MKRIRNTALRGITLFLAATALAFPAAAEHRSCHGQLVIRPQNPSMTYLSYDFSIAREVRLPHEYNAARRACRARMLSCVRDHWATPGAALPPDDCLNGREGTRVFRVNGYPFRNLEEELTETLCTANPGAETTLVTAVLTITGERGCVESGSRDRVTVASNFPVHCAAPASESEADEPGGNHPPIGEGGGWDCVGEDCDGSPPEEAETEPEADPLPPAASYQPLPMFRLPGNDLYLVELDAPNWLLCRQACTADPRCRAFTYRRPTAHSGPICLIKSGVGIPIPDACCQSGVKR